MQTEEGLRDYLTGFTGAPRDLIVAYKALAVQAAEEGGWLSEALYAPETQRIWFLAFLATQPAEVCAAYEYDFFARHACGTRAGAAIERSLDVRYSGRGGLHEAHHTAEWGARFFASRRADEQIGARLHVEGAGSETAVLRPRARWCWLHLALRRDVFLLLQRLADSCLLGDEHIAAYATALRHAPWLSSEGRVVTLEEMAAETADQEARVRFLWANAPQSLRRAGGEELRALIAEVVAETGDAPTSGLVTFPPEASYAFIESPQSARAFQRRIFYSVQFGAR